MLKKIYYKCLEWAAHKSSKFFLAIVSFTESSFFPIPPDIMIIPMVIAKKNDYIKIFLIATIFSTLGGLLGFFIGSFFLEIGMGVIELYGYSEKLIELQNKLSTNGGFLIWLGVLFLAGFTPLPFKLFTITSGMINFNLYIFFIICLIARGLRFFIVAFLSYKLGSKVTPFIEKNGSKWFTVIGLMILITASFIYFIFK